MNKVIEIIVGPAGQTSVQTKGFIGASCQEASRFIEQALGKRSREQLTGEFYQGTATHHVQQEGTS